MKSTGLLSHFLHIRKYRRPITLCLIMLALCTGLLTACDEETSSEINGLLDSLADDLNESDSSDDETSDNNETQSKSIPSTTQSETYEDNYVAPLTAEESQIIFDNVVLGDSGYYSLSDDFEDVSYYVDSRMKKLIETSATPKIYLAWANDHKGKVGMMCMVQYYGKEWLFFDRVRIKVGNDLYTLYDSDESIGDGDKKEQMRPNGLIDETYTDNTYPGKDSFEVFKAIANCNGAPVKARLSGQTNYDFNLSDEEILSIQHTVYSMNRFMDEAQKLR